MGRVAKQSEKGLQPVVGAIAEIRTPQELVHIRHRINLLQYKYWVLLLRAYRQGYERGERLAPNESCVLSRKVIEDALGYQPKTKEVERDLEAIRQEPIIYNVLQKDGQTVKRGHGFISEWFVSSSRIGAVLPTPLREAVENLDNPDSIFHKLNWNIFNSFSGKYEAILYKLCKDYVGVGWTKEMSTEAFRDYMGVAPEEYPDFKRLNQWTISGPLKKINASEVSDIEIEAIFRREKRRVVAVQFKVRLKRQSVLDFGEHTAFRFAKVRISPVLQQKYLALSDSETIEYSILRANEFAEEKQVKGEEVDLNKVYAKAIAEGWGDQYREKLKAVQEKERKAAVQEKNKKRKEEEAKRELEATAQRKAKGEAMLDAVGEDDLQSLFERWLEAEKPAPVMFKKGVESPAFRVWARLQLLMSDPA